MSAKEAAGRLRAAAATVCALVVLAGCGSTSKPAASATPTTDAAVVKARTAAGIAPCPTTDPAATAIDKGLPQVTLDCLGGDTHVNLAGLAKGKPMVVNFWAQWCGPCRTEGPWFGALYARSKAAGMPVTFLGIDEVDPIGADAVIATARQFGQYYALLSDPDGIARAPLHFSGLPQTMLVDAQGRIVYRSAGVLTSQAALQQLITKYLGVTL